MDLLQRIDDERCLACVEPAQRIGPYRCRHLLDCRQMRHGRAREMDAVRAPVGRIGTPLDESRARKLVDQARERDRLHLERFGEVDLTHAFTPRDVHERACLRHGQRAALLSLPVRAAHEARDVGDEESEVAGLSLHPLFI